MKKAIKSGVIYIRSHMWCSFALAILISVILLMGIMLGYTRNQYYEYLVSATYTTEQALLNSVNKNIESQMESFVSIGSSLCVDEELVSDILNYLVEGRNANSDKEIKTVLRAAARTSNTIVGISIVNSEGTMYQFDKMEMTGSGKPIWDSDNEKEILEIFETLKNKNNYIPRYEILTQPLSHPNDRSKGLIHIAFPIKYNGNYRDIQCMIIISYYNHTLNTLLKQVNENQAEYIQGYIEDENNKILLHTAGTEYLGKNGENYNEKKTVTDLSADIGNYGWKLHAVIDRKLITDSVNGMYIKMALLYIVAVIFIMIVFFWVTNRLLRPINMISNSISKVKTGNTEEQIPIEGVNEIWRLAQEYNEMLQAIRKADMEVQEQHSKVIESLKMKQRAEREALESQINAHFICNTLNAINYEAIDSGNYRISLLLKKLSNILRYTFDQKHQNVYMFQEISWIEQYLFLQKERLEATFDYRIDFDSDYDNWPCRKLMLQPFVENSILHGFEGIEKGGFIRIIGEGYKEYLKIIIEDNGCGMNEERACEIREILENPLLARERKVGIGISNVITRMKMYYGEKFRAVLDTQEGKGTRFVFILPLYEKGRKQDNDENFDSRGRTKGEKGIEECDKFYF